MKLDIKAGTIGQVVAGERIEVGTLNSTSGSSLDERATRRRRVLFVCAGPDGAPDLRFDRELRVVGDAMARLPGLVVEALCRTSRHDLRRRLLNHDFEMLHFSCHGTDEGLVLERQDGTGELLGVEDLVGFLRDNLDASKLHTLVFNACWSANVAAAAAPHFQHVVGISGPIDTASAVDFSTGFYEAFAAGRSIKRACEAGGRCVLGSRTAAGFELLFYEKGQRFRFRA